MGIPRGARCVALCPGAKHYTKRWPRDSFETLTDLVLSGSDMHIIVLGGSEDAPLGAALARRDPRVVNCCGSFSLLETAAAMDRCSVIVANDSGLMHMATARSVPVVAVFGSTVREFGFFPYNAVASVVEADGIPCRPCSHIGRARCPKGHFDCMRLIDAGRVWQAVNDLLGPNSE
jgi:heptosyltransferase-2